MSDISEHIKRAGIEDNFRIFSGHCLSVSIALKQYFGGNVLVVSETPKEGFDHAVTEINGLLYDGSGQVGWTETITRFIPPEARAETPELHYRKLNHPKTDFSSAFDQDVFKRILDRLNETK